MDFLSADSLPWLVDSQQRLRSAYRAGRLPHSLLLISAPGLGAEALANWAAALALCESAGTRPCDACASCRLLRADTHPDMHVVRLDEDAQQIKIDQVRELIESLTLKSYRGGYKVGIIEGAEALNANGANAFLKTLEDRAIDCRRPSPAAACASACGRPLPRWDLAGWRRDPRPASHGTRHLRWREEHHCWRCSWMAQGLPRSIPICGKAWRSCRAAPWM
jgi:DNA polymerase III, delta subunit